MDRSSVSLWIFVFPEIQPWVLSSYVDLAPAGDSVNYKTPAIIEKLVYRVLFCTVGMPGAASVACHSPFTTIVIWRSQCGPATLLYPYSLTFTNFHHYRHHNSSNLVH